MERLLRSLSGTDVYSHVKSDDFVLKDGDEVKGIAYVLETYGLIYNKTVLNAYCGMDGAKVSSIDEINSFAKLKEVADDIQSRLAEVSEAAGPEYDLKGAFTSAGMDSSSDWRFKTHLQTFQSTMNTKQMESNLQMLSKELTLITTNRSGIYTQQILLAKALC